MRCFSTVSLPRVALSQASGRQALVVRLPAEKLNPEAFHGLLDSLCEADDAKMPVVLSASSPSPAPFCTGLDWSYVTKEVDRGAARECLLHELELLAQVVLFMWNFPFPVIAAVTGDASREGACLAQACDGRVVLNGHGVVPLSNNSFVLPPSVCTVAVQECLSNLEEVHGREALVLQRAIDLATQASSVFAQEKKDRTAKSRKMVLERERYYSNVLLDAVFSDWETMRRLIN